MKKGNLHRGELLKRIVKDSGMKISTIIKKAGYRSKTSYYNHVYDRDLSAEILLNYGQALNYDFSIDIPEIKKIEAILTNENPQTLNEAKKQIDYWKNKYYDILEKYNQLIEIQLKK